MKLARYKELSQDLLFKGTQFTTDPSVEDDVINIRIIINVSLIDDRTLEEINKTKNKYNCSVFIKNNTLIYE